MVRRSDNKSTAAPTDGYRLPREKRAKSKKYRHNQYHNTAAATEAPLSCLTFSWLAACAPLRACLASRFLCAEASANSA